jgi:putative SOS response-associated peptidase YedK
VRRGKAKIPHYFQLRGGAAFGFAGLWEQWHGAGSTIVNNVRNNSPECLVPPPPSNSLFK